MNPIPPRLSPIGGLGLEFDLSQGDLLSVNIDSRKKIPATILLKAFGVPNNEELLKLFDAKEEEVDLLEEAVKGLLAAEDVYTEEGREVLRKNERISKEHLEELWKIGRTKVRVWTVDHALGGNPGAGCYQGDRRGYSGAVSGGSAPTSPPGWRTPGST